MSRDLPSLKILQVSSTIYYASTICNRLSNSLSLFWYLLATSQYYMGLTNVSKPQSTVLSSTLNKSQQYQDPLGNSEILIWVRSKYATSVLFNPFPPTSPSSENLWCKIVGYQDLRATGRVLKNPNRSGGTTPTLHLSFSARSEMLNGSSSCFKAITSFSGDRSVADSGKNAPWNFLRGVNSSTATMRRPWYFADLTFRQHH